MRVGGTEGHTITSTDRKPGRIGGPWHHISKSNNYSGRPSYLAGNYLHIIIIVKSLIEKIHKKIKKLNRKSQLTAFKA